MAVVTKDEAVKQAQTLVNPAADVHHMVRKISLNPDPNAGMMTVDEVDSHVRNWLQAGYKLHSTHFVGQEAGAYVIIYILVKE